MADHYDYFVAAKYRNKDEALRLTKSIRDKGNSTYCFVESRASIEHCGKLDCDGEEAMEKFEAISDWRNDAGIREIFNSDIGAERDSDTFVLLLPAGKSCHIEAGVAYGLGKKLILIGEQKEAESLYLIFDETYPTIESFIDSI